jgi:hypothetical protein
MRFLNDADTLYDSQITALLAWGRRHDGHETHLNSGGAWCVTCGHSPVEPIIFPERGYLFEPNDRGNS